MKRTTLLFGLAMFSMFFGAGNIIFPLALGQTARDHHLSAFLGLFISAVLIPFTGVFAMILFNGDTRAFFEKLGKPFGLAIALLVIVLLGPCGSTPRCIALTYGTLKNAIPMPLIPFNLLACGLVYFFASHKTRMLSMLGSYLTPLLLGSLGLIVGSGLIMEGTLTPTDLSPLTLFQMGLKEGYNTMDLLAAFFFSSAIIASLKELSYAKPLKISMEASLIGASLLALVYLGFSTLASLHGGSLNVSKDELLFALAKQFTGPYAGTLVCITIALACMTTAIALLSVFADFISRLLKWDYQKTLLLSTLVTFIVSTLEFEGISTFLGPILEICYPGLIVLTLLNICNKLWNFPYVKWPVFLTFAYSAAIRLL